MSRFDELWDGYLADRLTTAEVTEMLDIMSKDDKSLDAGITSLLNGNTYGDLADPVVEEKIFQKVLAHTKAKSKGKVISWRIMAAAAAVVLLFSSTIFFLQRQTADSRLALQQKDNTKTGAKDIPPGGDKAILTLADGRKIVLDTAANGAITSQGGITIIKVGGQLTYDQQTNATEVLYNTITTPRGGQYQLELADGTKVWLNAASSLSFPTAFPGNDRSVELTGEGYFEVAHNAQKPFHVKVNDMDVEVMGTHFNINSYENEPAVKTTLLEGKVKVSKGERLVYLNPGQQAIVESNQIATTSNVDPDQVTAWKQGLFNFEHSNVYAILRELSRWYDVEVQYSGSSSDKELFGIISRNSPLSSVLKALKATEKNMTYRIEQRKLIVQFR